MPANVEIKAKVRDMQRLRESVSRLSGGLGEVILQEDVFYHARQGRIKLRRMQDRPTELIFYERPNTSGPKRSDFKRVIVSEEMHDLLSLALGVKGVVRKKRELHLVGQTRVHVDEVEGLGNFMELEVMLEDGQSSESGQNVAEQLMKELGIDDGDLLSGAYMDLILGDDDASEGAGSAATEVPAVS